MKSIAVCCLVFFAVHFAGGIASLGQDDNNSDANSTESDSRPNPDPDGVMEKKTPEDLTPADLEAARKLQKLMDADAARAERVEAAKEAANHPSGGSGGLDPTGITCLLLPFAIVWMAWKAPPSRGADLTCKGIRWFFGPKDK